MTPVTASGNCFLLIGKSSKKLVSTVVRGGFCHLGQHLGLHSPEYGIISVFQIQFLNLLSAGDTKTLVKLKNYTFVI
jgi:hypothetical protein